MSGGNTHAGVYEGGMGQKGVTDILVFSTPITDRWQYNTKRDQCFFLAISFHNPCTVFMNQVEYFFVFGDTLSICNKNKCLYTWHLFN